MGSDQAKINGLHYSDRGQRVLDKPSVGIMIGQVLAKCAHIKKGMAIRSQDDDKQKAVERFVALYAAEWSDTVSCPALNTLKVNTYNKADELPSTEDLLRLKAYTEEQMSEQVKQLKTLPTYNVWRKLAEITLTRLLVFNKRRASEPAMLEVEQYKSRPDWTAASNQELLNNLEPLEKRHNQWCLNVC
jgi:hypothetical protein